MTLRLRDGRRVFTWIGLTLTLWATFAVVAVVAFALFVLFALPAIDQLVSRHDTTTNEQGESPWHTSP